MGLHSPLTCLCGNETEWSKETMLKLLFIEDDKESIEDILDLIEKEIEDVCHEVSEFEDANDKIASLRPDIVILDLLSNGASPEAEAKGLETDNFIWNQHFCPIVVYSAQPEIYDDERKLHPFIKSVQKGQGSPQEVLDAICELRPHVDALKETESYIRDSFSHTMRDVAPYAFKFFSDSDSDGRTETIKRSGRRRLAALMDELSLSPDKTKLASWEQYLCPPVCENIQLGDILRSADKTDKNGEPVPALFRVVLTPSCDLVTSENRKPKAPNVLVAKCCSVKDGLDRTELKDMSEKKLKERLPSILTRGYFEAVIPFPGLKGRIPTMAANLRDLELIPINEISDSDGQFHRVASVDSPFRELISWAYMQIAGRPGLPDRDFASWADEIITTLKNERSEKK